MLGLRGLKERERRGGRRGEKEGVLWGWGFWLGDYRETEAWSWEWSIAFINLPTVSDIIIFGLWEIGYSTSKNLSIYPFYNLDFYFLNLTVYIL